MGESDAPGDIEVLSEFQGRELLASTKLREIVMRRVAFEVDGWDPDTGIGWSVVLKGVAQEVTKGIDPFAATLRERPVYPLAPGEREHWIATYQSEISGRRFHR